MPFVGRGLPAVFAMLSDIAIGGKNIGCLEDALGGVESLWLVDWVGGLVVPSLTVGLLS